MNAARRPTPPRPTTARAAKPPAGATPAAGAKPATRTGSTGRQASGATAPATPKARRSAESRGGGRQSIRQVSSDWLAGIRFSGFSIIMMGVLVLAVIVLAPSIASYAEQRQQIAELKAEVARQEAEVDRLTEQRERWNDETYIVTQARDRLYYVLPGEVSYLVIDDRSPDALANADRIVSREVTEQRGDWMQTMLRSVMTAGLAPAASDAPAAPTEPEPTEPPVDEGTR